MPHIDFGYVSYNNLEKEYPDLVPLVNLESDGRMDTERLFHTMTQAQLELAICLYFGFTSKEIVKILQYPNIAHYYTMRNSLRQFYKLQNA